MNIMNRFADVSAENGLEKRIFQDLLQQIETDHCESDPIRQIKTMRIQMSKFSNIWKTNWRHSWKSVDNVLY